MTTHLIDGANGFVASHLIAALLADRRPVVGLARAPREVVLERVGAALGCLGHDPALADRLPVHPIDLQAADLALPAAQVFAGPCVFWHTAALITFNPARDAEMEPINIAGAVNTMTTFEKHAAPGSRFVAVSTAYQCGLDTENVTETWADPAPPQRFHNFYEYTKREAELALAATTPMREGNATVARLGIIVGHSRTGQALTDSGLYTFLRTITHYARGNPGQDLRIPCHPQANLHFMPIDTTIDRLLPLAEAQPGDPIHHLVGGGSVTATDLFTAINHHLPITLIPATPEQITEHPLTPFEAAVNLRVKHVTTYLRQHYNFAIRDPATPTAVTPDTLDHLIGWYTRQSRGPVGTDR